MKKILLIPTMLLPYSFILGLLTSEIFPEDMASYVFALFDSLFFAAALICNVIFIILSRKDDARTLIGVSLLIKLIHIPSYIAVFIFGAVAAIMIFMTFPLILMLILFDCVMLFFSSTISVFVLAKNIRNNPAVSTVALICQFFFCADVISLIVAYFVSRKRRSVPSVY